MDGLAAACTIFKALTTKLITSSRSKQPSIKKNFDAPVKKCFTLTSENSPEGPQTENKRH